MDEIIAYYRVSTQSQGMNGLGMAAQREAVERYASTADSTIIGSFEEVETARRDSLRNRPQLRAALANARRSGATLVIARIDRLARSVLVTAELMASGVDFVACDNPYANRFTIHILAALAERNAGSLYSTIAEKLNADGYRTPRGLFWNAASINNIMSRRGINHRSNSKRL